MQEASGNTQGRMKERMGDETQDASRSEIGQAFAQGEKGEQYSNECERWSRPSSIQEQQPMQTDTIFRQSEQDVLQGLHSSREGLSQQEAHERQAIYGSNLFERSQPSALRILGRQVKSSLVYLLFFACLFCFFLQDISDGIIITTILFINTILGV